MSSLPPSTSSAPKRILVRGVNWLGDAVMTTPALLRLREARPEVHIALLTNEKLADLWRGHPAIDEVQTFSKREGPWTVGQRLRSGRFDLSVALPNSQRSALELWFAGIPERIGYTRPFRNFFLTTAVPKRPGAVTMRKRSIAEIKRLISQPESSAASNLPASVHHIFQYLHLMAALGSNVEPLAPSISVSESELSAFRQRLNHLSGSGHALWLGLNPGAEYGPAKRWPADRFVSAALDIHRATGCSWIIFGTNDPATRQVAGELEIKLGPEQAVNLSGQTTLRELCAGLRFCRLILTNDSGPMHVAAAVGRPVVVPFGSTSSAMTGPGLPGMDDHCVLQSSAACTPCFLRECPIDFRCMKSIEVPQVVRACLRLLRKL